MRKVEEHADVAFHASWHEAHLTSKEEGWTPPAGVPAEYTPQAVASFKIDEKAHSKLVNEFDEAASPRDARRLLRCAQPHAQEIASPATTLFATWLRISPIKACSRQCSRSKASWALPLVDAQVM